MINDSLIVRLAGAGAPESGRSAVIPRLEIGQLLQGLVLEVRGAQALVRVRGQEFVARTDVALTPSTVVHLEVVEFSEQRLVFRLASSDGALTEPRRLDSSDLGALLRSLGQADNEISRAAARALLGARQPVRSEALQRLVRVAEQLGDASSTTLRAAVELLRRGLPVTSETVRIARGFAQAPGDLGRLLERLSALIARTGTPALPARVMTAVRELLAAVPRLRLGGEAAPNPPATAATPPGSGRPAAAPAGASPASAPPVPPASQPLGGSTTAASSAGPTSNATTPLSQSTGAASSARPASNTATAQTQSTPLAEGLRAVLEHGATSPERQLASGRAGEAPAELRIVLARAMAAVVGELDATEDPAMRGILCELRGLLTDAETGFEARQLANAAPRGDPSQNVYLFSVPVQTSAGWTSAELAVHRRSEGRPIDPDDFRVAIRLDLPHVGQVRVAVAVRRGVVSCGFSCSRIEGLHALERAQGELLEGLRDRGLQPGRLTHALLAEPLAEQVTEELPAGRLDTRA